MAGGHIKFTLDTELNKTGINQLKQELQSLKALTSQQMVDLGFSKTTAQAKKDLVELKDSVSQVEAALNKSFSASFGTTNLTKFNQELKNLNLNQIQQGFNKAGQAGQVAFRNLTTEVLTTKLQLKETNGLLAEMGKTMTNTIRWGLASSAMNSITGAAQKAWTYVKSLDKSLNDIRIVSNKSAEDMERFATQANRAAKALGSSTRGYTDAALIYYQQGLSDEEVKKRTDTTIKMANVTGQSEEAVSDYMTAIWNNFAKGGENLEYFADVMAKLGAATASSADEIAGGLEKFAAVADTVGLSYEYAAAALATITAETRQSEDVVGTALKTIFARIQGLELGETLEDGTTLNKYSEALQKVGIDIVAQNGELKDMDIILEELGQKWETLNKDQQVALAQTVAGVRQYNQLVALMDKWDTFQNNLNLAANATGELNKQQSIYMDSMEAHLNKLVATKDRILDSLGDTKGINELIDAVDFLASGVANFVESIGGSHGVLLTLGALGTQVFGKQLAQGLATTITNLKKSKENAKQLNAELEVFKQFKELKVDDPQFKALINMKERILALNKTLTDEQREEANLALERRNNLENELVLWKEKVEEAQRFYQLATGTNIGEKQSAEQLLKKKNVLQEKNQNFIDFGKNFSKALDNNGNGGVLRDIEYVTEGSELLQPLDELVEIATKENLDSARELQKAYAEYKKEVLSHRAVEILDFENYDAHLDTIGAEVTEKLIKAYKKTSKEITEKTKDTLDTIDKMVAKTGKNIENQIEETTDTFEENIKKWDTQGVIESFFDLEHSIFSVASAINSITSIPNIWDNENLTMGEKVLQTVLAVTSAINGSIGAYKGWRAFIDGLKASMRVAVITSEAAEAAAVGKTVEGMEKKKTLLEKTGVEALKNKAKIAEDKFYNSVVDSINKIKKKILTIQEEQQVSHAASVEEITDEQAYAVAISDSTDMIEIKNKAQGEGSLLNKEDKLEQTSILNRAKMVAQDKNANDKLISYLNKKGYTGSYSNLPNFKDIDSLLAKGLSREDAEEMQKVFGALRKQSSEVSKGNQSFIRIGNQTGMEKLVNFANQQEEARLKNKGPNFDNSKKTVEEIQNSADKTKKAVQEVGEANSETIEENVSDLKVLGNFLKKMPTWAKVGLGALSVLAVLAGLQKLIAYINEAYNIENQLNKAIEESAAAVEAANESYNSVLNSVSSYQDAIDGFSGLKEGTMEWYDALLKANEAAQEIIKSLDLIAGEDYYIDSMGKIIIKEESLEEKKFAAQKNVYAAQANNYGDQAALAKYKKEQTVSDFVKAVNEQTADATFTLDEDQAKKILLNQSSELGEVKSTDSKKVAEALKENNKTLSNIDKQGNSYTTDISALRAQYAAQYKKYEMEEQNLNYLKAASNLRVYSTQDEINQFNQMSSIQQQVVTRKAANTQQNTESERNRYTYNAGDTFTGLSSNETIKNNSFGSNLNRAAELYNATWDAERAQAKNGFAKGWVDLKYALGGIGGVSLLTYGVSNESKKARNKLKEDYAAETSTNIDAVDEQVAVDQYYSGASGVKGVIKEEQEEINTLKRHAQNWLGSDVGTDAINYAVDTAYAYNSGYEDLAKTNLSLMTKDELKAAYDIMDTPARLSFAKDMGVTAENPAGTLDKIQGVWGVIQDQVDQYKEAAPSTSEDQQKQTIAAIGGAVNGLKEQAGIWREQRNAFNEDLMAKLEAHETDWGAREGDLLAKYNSELERQATALGTSADALDFYRIAMQKADGTLKELNTDVAKAAAQEYAFNKAYNEGVSTFNDNREAFELYRKSLKKGEKISYDLADSMAEIKKSMEELFGYKVSANFVSDNLDLVEQLFTGTEKQAEAAYDALKQIQYADAVTQAFQGLEGFSTTWAQQLGAELSQLQPGAALSSSMNDALIDMVNNSNMTRAQIEELFNTLEIDIPTNLEIPEQVNIKEHVFGGNSKQTVHSYDGDMPVPDGNGGVKTVTVNYKWVETIEEAEQAIRIPEGTNLNVSTQKENYKNFTKSLSNKKANNGGSNNKKEHKESELDRYQKVNSQLAKINNTLDKLQDYEEKLAGAKLFENWEKQLKSLNNQIDVTKDKIAIAVDEANEYKQELINTYGIKVNPDGIIDNYKQIYEKELAKYNAAVDKYNKSKKSEADEKAFEKSAERYEKYNELIQKYDELIGTTIPGLEADIRDAIDKQIELKINAFKYELDLKLDIKDAKLDWNEFKKTVLDGIEETDILGNTQAKLKDVEVYFEGVERNILETNTNKINDLLTDLKKMDEDLDGKIYKDNRQQAMDDLKEYYEAAISNLTEIHELSEEIHDSYMEMMDEAQEKFDEQIEAYSTISDLIEHDKNVITMIYGEESYSALSKFYDKQESNNNKQLDFQKQQVEFWANQMTLVEEGSEEWDKAKENWLSAVSEWNSAVEAAIQNLQDKYLNAINEIFQKLNNEVTGGLGLGYVEEEWSLINRNAEEYLDSVNAIYGVQQLQSKYLDAIEQNDSTIQQKKLNDLMEQEMGYLREQDKLSQYDLDRANLKYEIALKQIALEEAQQNKTQLRLRRDSQGNYSYQYTADDDQVSSIQQEISDLYNQLYNLDAEEYRVNLESLYDVWVEFQGKMAEAAQINDPEQRAERELLIKEQYGELINTLTEKNELVQVNLNQSTMSHLFDLYDQNIENYDMMTAEQQAILDQFMTAETDFTNAAFDNLFNLYNLTVENFKGMSSEQQDILMGEIVPQWETAVQAMADKIIGEGGFFPVCAEAFSQLAEATESYETSLKTLQETAGTSFEEVKKGIDPVIESTELLLKDNNDLITSYENELQAVQDVIDKLDTLKGKYAEVITKTKEATEAAAKYWMDAANTDAEADPSKVLDAEFGTETDVTTDLNQPGTDNNTPQESVKPALEKGSYVEVKSGTKWYANSYGGGASGKAKSGTIKYINTKGSHAYNINGAGWIKKTDIVGYATGGYTGDWAGGDGRLAMLHQKELVLNANDTKNMLSAIEIVREITSNLGTMLMSRMANIGAITTQGANSGELEQNVHITAEFPNVTSSREIEEALNNLTNKASQYIQTK